MARRMLGEEQIKLFETLGILDHVIEKVQEQLLVITEEDGEALVGDGDWVDCEIDLTLDSGCVDHIIDLGDCPGYEAFMVESAKSKRKQGYIVGNGARVPNEGEVCLNLEHDPHGFGNLIKSTFQVAEVTRPLMSVSRICDLGMECRFKHDEALVVNEQGKTVARFARQGGLYIARMRLKPPEGFAGQVPR